MALRNSVWRSVWKFHAQSLRLGLFAVQLVLRVFSFLRRLLFMYRQSLSLFNKKLAEYGYPPLSNCIDELDE